MTNLLQDPSVLIYDNLFFGLTLGKYHLHVSTESGSMEEFLIIREAYYCKLELLEKIIPNLMKKAGNIATFSSQKPFFQSNRIIIDFIIYSNLNDRELLGLGLRVKAYDRMTLTFLGTSSENRLQKIMFLLSRGLLKSSFHQINQKCIVIDLC